jgi:hypothetical protein
MSGEPDLGPPERRRRQGGIVTGARVQSEGGLIVHEGARARVECALDALLQGGALTGSQGGRRDREAVGRTRYEAGLSLRRLFHAAGLTGVHAFDPERRGAGGDISDAQAGAFRRYNRLIRHLGDLAPTVASACCHDRVASAPPQRAALTLGGVGLLAVTLLSVRERYSEIGLRIAIGAAPRDIMVQFLTEAVMLALMGGVAGILVGGACIVLGSQLTGWTMALTWETVTYPFLISLGIAIVFGAFPALRASRLDPIVALRSA